MTRHIRIKGYKEVSGLFFSTHGGLCVSVKFKFEVIIYSINKLLILSTFREDFPRLKEYEARQKTLSKSQSLNDARIYAKNVAKFFSIGDIKYVEMIKEETISVVWVEKDG